MTLTFVVVFNVSVDYTLLYLLINNELLAHSKGKSGGVCVRVICLLPMSTCVTSGFSVSVVFISGAGRLG